MTAPVPGPLGRKKQEPKSPPTVTQVRMRRALWLLIFMLGLSVVLLVLGVYTTTRSESLNVSGYVSGAVLTLGSFIGLLGLCLEENRKQLLTAAIVFLSLGIVSAFVCLLIDGVGVVLTMDVRPLRAERCQYYSSGGSYVYENFYTSVSCWNLKESCSMTVRSGTCYCCDLYDCANGGFLSNYYEFVGVQSCEEVFTLYVMIWTLVALNLVAFFTGILTTAVLGSIKELRMDTPVTKVCKRTTSPTAPCLVDTDTHTEHQRYPDVPTYVPPSEKTQSSHSFPTSSNLLPDSALPPPFAPPTRLKLHGLSA